MSPPLRIHVLHAYTSNSGIVARNVVTELMKNTITGLVILLCFQMCSFIALQTEADDSSLRVMSFNIYRGGTFLGQPLSQTARVICKANADIVGIQETRSPDGVNAERLAKLLGWNHYVNPRNRVVLTRYEIIERFRDGVKVKLPKEQMAYIFNLHLPSNPYQPYQLLNIRPKWHKHWDTPFIKTEAEAIAFAKLARGGEVSTILNQISKLADRDVPVFVVGDFNEPSHLDWTQKAMQSGIHPLKVDYPTSLRMAHAGFYDAWRKVHPDEIKFPGFTWSPSTKADDPKDHHDRIDYVYFKGSKLKLVDAEIVGKKKRSADIVIRPYPSDHRAVIATFKMTN